MNGEINSVPMPEKAKVIAGFLTSAIDMEDEMSGDVYGEFLSRESWPVLMDEDAFQNIKELLTILIQETARHKKIFSELLNQLKSDVN